MPLANFSPPNKRSMTSRLGTCSYGIGTLCEFVVPTALCGNEKDLHFSPRSAPIRVSSTRSYHWLRIFASHSEDR